MNNKELNGMVQLDDDELVDVAGGSGGYADYMNDDYVCPKCGKSIKRSSAMAHGIKCAFNGKSSKE